MEGRRNSKRKRLNIINSSSEEDNDSRCDENSKSGSSKRPPNPYIEQECTEGQTSNSEESLDNNDEDNESTTNTFESSDSGSSGKKTGRTSSADIHRKISRIDEEIAALFKKRKRLVRQLNTSCSSDSN